MAKRNNYYAGVPTLAALLEAVGQDWTNIHAIAARIKWNPRPEFIARWNDSAGGRHYKKTAIIKSFLKRSAGKMATKRSYPVYFDFRDTNGVEEFRLNAAGAQRLTVYRARESVPVAPSETRRRGSA